MNAEWVKNFSRKLWLFTFGAIVALLCVALWQRIQTTTKPRTITGNIQAIEQVTATIKVNDVQVHGVDLTLLNTLSRGQQVQVKALPSNLNDGSLDASIKCDGCGIKAF